jgi:hypothetical protein
VLFRLFNARERIVEIQSLTLKTSVIIVKAAPSSIVLSAQRGIGSLKIKTQKLKKDLFADVRVVTTN